MARPGVEEVRAKALTKYDGKKNAEELADKAVGKYLETVVRKLCRGLLEGKIVLVYCPIVNSNF